MYKPYMSQRHSPRSPHLSHFVVDLSDAIGIQPGKPGVGQIYGLYLDLCVCDIISYHILIEYIIYVRYHILCIVSYIMYVLCTIHIYIYIYTKFAPFSMYGRILFRVCSFFRIQLLVISPWSVTASGRSMADPSCLPHGYQPAVW